MNQIKLIPKTNKSNSTVYSDIKLDKINKKIKLSRFSF